MKKILFIIAVCFAFMTNMEASIIPSESLLIIDNDEVELSLENLVQGNMFAMANYSEADDSFNFITHSETKFIQIFGPNGELEYQLPVLSRKIRIKKSLFNKGEYKLGFMFDGHDRIEFTGVKVK